MGVDHGLPGRRCSRRRFLGVAGAAALAPLVVPGRVLGLEGATPPSEQIVLGGIGIGNRGTGDLGCFLAEPDVRCLAICDVKAARRQAVKQMVDQHYGGKDCAIYRDLRELLARSDIDAVLIATGPNWHATASCLAARAGKDIYCEKPCTKSIVESLALRDTMCGRGGSSRPARSGATSLTSRSPASWPAAGSSGICRRSMPIPPAWGPA